MKRALLVGLLFAIGCGNKYDSDWSDKPLESQTITIQGFAITLKVPKGLPRDADDDPGTWSVTKVEGDFVPKIFVKLDTVGHESIDDFVGWVIYNKKKMNLVRKETRPDGYAVTDAPADKHRVEAITLEKLGDKTVQCTAVQIGDGELPSYDKTRAMLEAICDSISAGAPTK